MAVLYISPDSSPLVHAAAAAVLYLHIGAGGVGILAGTAAFVMFMITGSVAAIGDLRLILNRGITGPTRLARHLWRMTIALFIAANSLFLGQPQLFPKAVQKSGLLGVPALLILSLLLFWLGHVGWGAHKRKNAGRLQAA